MLTLLVLAATIGAELDPTTAVMGPAANQQRTPAAAWDGTAWLTVWQDHRPDGAVTGLRATWLNTFLVGPDFPVTLEPAQFPAVDCGATGCLVAWRLSGIRVARVVAGTLLDTTPIDFDVQPGGAPSVSCTGARCLVVYPTTAGPLRAARFDLATGLVDVVPLTVTGSATEASVAFDGAQWVVAWSDGADVSVTRVNTSGVVGATASVAATATSEVRPRIACVTAQCLVSWEAGTALRVRRVDSAGPIDTTSFLVANGTVGTALSATMTTVAGWYAIGWSSGSGPSITHARLSTMGALSLSMPTIPVTVGGLEPTLSSDGTSLFLAWAAFVATESDIFARPGTTNVLLSRAANYQRAPSVAATDGGFFLAWQDQRATTMDVWSAQLDARGQTRDAGGLLISAAAGAQLAPAVTCGSSSCVVAWSDLRASSVGEGRSTIVSPTGALSDPNGRLSLVDGLVDKIALATDGRTSLAFWSAGSNLAAMPLDATGVPLRATPVDLGAADSFLTGGVAFGTNVYFVVATALNASTGDDDVVGARISTSGMVLDVPPLVIGADALGHGGVVSRQPVASSGTVFLVAWDNAGMTEVRLYSPDGATLTPPLSLGNGARPSVTFDGVHFVLSRHTPEGLSLVRLTLNGALVSPQVVIPFSAFEVGGEVSLASAAPGTVLVAYSRFDSTAGVGTRRVRTRFVEFDTDGGIQPVDAGVPDAGVGDAGSSSDAGSSDAGFDDGGFVDAGSSDAGFDDGGFVDGGFVDGGFVDGGFVDGGFVDGGFVDGGFVDGGFVDGGFVDGGFVDGGFVDGGFVDGGFVDGGFVDGGFVDGGFVDAGSSSDSDAGSGMPRDFGVGCACSSSSGALPLLLFGFVLARRRRLGLPSPRPSPQGERERTATG